MPERFRQIRFAPALDFEIRFKIYLSAIFLALSLSHSSLTRSFFFVLFFFFGFTPRFQKRIFVSFSQYNVVLCFFFCFAAFSTHTFCLYRKRIEIKFIVNIVNNFPYKYFFFGLLSRRICFFVFLSFLNPSVLLR